MTRHSRVTARFATAAVVAFVASATAANAQALKSGIDTANFDHSVRPQDDFYGYVNGGWLKKAVIRGDATSTGAFNELADSSRKGMHELFEEAAKPTRPMADKRMAVPLRSAAGPSEAERRKIGDLYASYMDSTRVERLGLKPLAGEMKTIAALKSNTQLAATFAHFAKVGVGSPISVGVGQDAKASSVNIVQIGQSGLGLPDRDYYLKNDTKSVAIRAAYVDYLTKMFALAKQPDPAGAAQRVLGLETSLAAKQWDRVRSRDRNATYNKMTVAELAQLTPSYDWNAYLKASKLTKATDVIVRQPDYLRAVDTIMKATPASTWREYLTAKLLDSNAEELPSAFGETRFEFRGKTLTGQQEQTPRWRRAVAGTEGILPDATGKLYVEHFFRPEAKTRMDALVKNILNAYSVGIDSLEWMSPATKAAAKEKLAHFTVKIGYPDKPRDYSTLVIKRDDLLGNRMRARAFDYNDGIARLGKPVDRTRWGMTAQTVNAYYNPANNEIVFPAAILQPPFFNVAADDAVNYGGIGAVIGHEIGHGFDDQGRKSDGAGNLRDWWTASDATAFDARTTRLGAQYDAINPIDDLHVNGKLTMGENIGDLSGLAQAYRAYRISLNGKEPPVIDGLTGNQRFFMGYAQVWRSKMRDEALRQRILTDPHSPGPTRAFVPLVNNDVFAKTFNLKPGDKMYVAPADRVKIW
ncbi:MAG: M13 family metallopeptidase [Gemmatimonadota bacterium]|nr:M13 family metallopeptidase [Gemmatimonadota bacterium]